MCGLEWEILGSITEARDDAELEDAPGDVCSARMVVPWAIQALSQVLASGSGAGSSSKPTRAAGTRQNSTPCLRPLWDGS